MKSFILEVVSNASMDVYPNNTLSSFINFLPEPINLDDKNDGTWEVALMEIAHPTWYFNVSQGKFWYRPHKESAIFEITIRKGLYKNIESVLIEMINAITYEEKMWGEQVSNSLQMKVDSFTKKILFEFSHDSAVLNLASLDLANILGFSSTCLIPGTLKESHLPYDVQRIHTIMVYTNLIEHGIIGDTKAPILRTFPLIPRFKDNALAINQHMNYQSFPNLQFKKILKTSFHSIQVELRSASGEKIPFAGIGNTRLTLLFRESPN